MINVIMKSDRMRYGPMCLLSCAGSKNAVCIDMEDTRKNSANVLKRLKLSNKNPSPSLIIGARVLFRMSYGPKWTVPDLKNLLAEFGHILGEKGSLLLQWDSRLTLEQCSNVREYICFLIQGLLRSKAWIERVATNNCWVVRGVYQQYPAGARPKYIVPLGRDSIPWKRRFLLWRSVVALSRHGRFLQKSMRLFSLVAGFRIFQLFSPAFILVMNKSTDCNTNNFIDEICTCAFGEPRPWPVMMVRPMKVAILPIYDGEQQCFDYLRVALNHHAGKRLRRHRHLCKYVHSLGLRFQVPEQLAAGTYAGVYYQIESEVSGIDGRRAHQKAVGMCYEAVKILIDIFNATSSTMTENTFRRWTRRISFVEQMDLIGSSVSQEYIKKIVRTVLSELGFMCIAQNDCHLGNILFDKRGKVTSVIDWDIADKCGLPGTDLCHLFIDFEMTVHRQSFGDAVKSVLDKTNRMVERCFSLYEEGTALHFDRYNLVAAYLLVDMWRKAYFLYTEEVRKNSDQYKLLASEVMMAFEIIQGIISNRSSV